MKMASVGTVRNTQSCCINCAVRFQRNVRRQLLSETAADVRQLVSRWISRELQPLEAVCENCFMILKECIQTGHSVRRFGYRNICISCGSSILRAHQTHAVHVDTAERNIILQWIPLHQQDSSESDIKLFCPKCRTEVSHTAEEIQEDQTKILIAKVYHYLEQEYEELKAIYGDLDLTPLSKFRQRTALATGVSETTILQILQEEEARNAEKRQEPPKKRSGARKRSIQIESSSEEDSSDDNVDANEQSSTFHEDEMLVVKVETSEDYNEEPEIYFPATVKVELSDTEGNKDQAQTDPIAVDVKRERSPQSPRSDVFDNTSKTLALTEPTETKRKGRKIPRSDVTSTCTSETLALTQPDTAKRKGRKIPRSDVTSARQHTLGESSTEGASSSARPTEEVDEGGLFGGDTQIKEEDIEMHEGVS